ncbi:MAG: HNH endonuclease [Fimbriimonadales bacterium]
MRLCPSLPACWRWVRAWQACLPCADASANIYSHLSSASPHRGGLRVLDAFTPEQKQQILERDGYRCVICGRGVKDGVELHVDHIKPQHLGGKSEIENGQTVCAPCNFKKKVYKQTETGKRMFIRLYEIAKKQGDEKVASFCEDVLRLYEKHNINDHIKWEP